MKNKYDFQKTLPLVSILAVLIILVVFIISYNLNRYNYDPRHNGIAYLYAQYIKENFLVFPKIYFMYGIINSYIDYISIVIFGDKVLSIILINNVFYYSGITLLYFYSSKFLKDQKSLLLILIVLASHPVLIYPWHSYKTFLLILIALICIQNRNLYLVILGGLSLSITGFLYNLNFIVSFLVFIYFLVNFYIYKDKSYFNTLLASYLIPIFLFLVMLAFTNNFSIWLQNIEANFQFGKISSGGSLSLFLNFVTGIFYEIPKTKLIYLNCYTAFLIIFIYNIYYSLINLNKFLYGHIKDHNLNLIYSISVISIISVILSLAGVEIFRLLLSLSLGLIVLIYNLILNKRNFLFKIFIIYSLSSILFPLLSSSTTIINNQTFLDKNLETVKNMKILNNFKLSKFSINQYKNYEKFLVKVKKDCNLKYFYNSQEKNFFLYSISKNYLENKQKLIWQNSYLDWESKVNKIYGDKLQYDDSLIIINSQNQKKYLSHHIAHEFIDYKYDFLFLVPNSCKFEPLT